MPDKKSGFNLLILIEKSIQNFANNLITLIIDKQKNVHK